MGDERDENLLRPWIVQSDPSVREQQALVRRVQREHQDRSARRTRWWTLGIAPLCAAGLALGVLMRQPVVELPRPLHKGPMHSAPVEPPASPGLPSHLQKEQPTAAARPRQRTVASASVRVETPSVEPAVEPTYTSAEASDPDMDLVDPLRLPGSGIKGDVSSLPRAEPRGGAVQLSWSVLTEGQILEEDSPVAQNSQLRFGIRATATTRVTLCVAGPEGDGPFWTGVVPAEAETYPDQQYIVERQGTYDFFLVPGTRCTRDAPRLSLRVGS